MKNYKVGDLLKGSVSSNTYIVLNVDENKNLMDVYSIENNKFYYNAGSRDGTGSYTIIARAK